MKRAETDGCPALALDGTRLGIAVMPLLLVLGAGAPLALGQAGGNDEPPGEEQQEEVVTEEEAVPEAALQEPVEDPVPLEEIAEPEAPAELIELEAPVQEEALQVAPPEAKVSGYADLRTRSRWAEDRGDDDHELYGIIAADMETGGEHSWGVHVMARGRYGLNSQTPDSVFFNELDTHDNRLDGDIYHAYVDAPVDDYLALLRVGRMVIFNTPRTAYLDGIIAETNPTGPAELAVGAYAGNSVHLSEAWPSDEWMGGMYGSLQPWERGKFRVDWMRLNDDVRFDERITNLISFDLSQRVTKNLRLEGEFSLLNGARNDTNVKGFWLLPEQDLTVRLSYYRLLKAQTDFAYELNPFFNSMRTHHPYDQAQLVVSKTFGEEFQLFGGLDTRRVENGADVGTYNRDFDRYYLTAALLELLPLQTTVSATGEIWDSPGNDIQTWGLDLTSKVDEMTKASIGSYYSLYKYYLDTNAERDNVRTFYGEFRRELSESMSFIARYEYENEVIDTFHNLRLGLTWRF